MFEYTLLVAHTGSADHIQACLSSIFAHTVMTRMCVRVCDASSHVGSSYYLKRIANEFTALGMPDHFVVVEAQSQDNMSCWQTLAAQPVQGHVIVVNDKFRAHADWQQNWSEQLQHAQRITPLRNCVVIAADHWHHEQQRMSHNSDPFTSHTHDVTWCDTHEQAAQQLHWMRTTNAESEELFDEVIAHNVYGVTHDHVRGHSVIDVGANQGMFSLLCAVMGAPQVISCEPVSSTHHTLTQHIHNSHMAHVITPIQAAVLGVAMGDVNMSINTKSGHNSLYTQQDQSEQVATMSLQQLVAQCTQSKIYLKMDCEGSEYDILMDTPDPVFDHIDRIAVEIHGRLHPRYKGVEIAQHRLAQLGYQLHGRKIMMSWNVDSQGKPQNYQPLDITIETWCRP